MQLGLRPLVGHPEEYKDFYLLRNHGRYYAVPAFLDPEDDNDLEKLRFHPAAVAASTLEELQALIDGLSPDWVTVMRFSDFAWRDVPDSWLQRDYLPRFSPE